ncbi:MAG: NTP transferase domain-containing protein [Candidatus Pacebacteria bacterium]|nr:NTP transferase domain-containing protein [Candidatus Paceibacterota bacterium]
MTHSSTKPPVVLLAAGSSNRFFPFNNQGHKSTLPLLGKPIFIHTLENLQRHQYQQLIIIIKPEHEQQFSRQLQTHQLRAKLIHQPESKGMGHALLQAKDHLKSDQFFVIEPAQIQAGQYLDQMLTASREVSRNSSSSQAKEVLLASQTNAPWRYGILQIKNDRAVSIVEKPEKGTETSQTKLSAIYLLSQRFLNILKQVPTEHYSFETALNQLMQQEPIKLVQTNQPPPSFKYPWHLFDVQQKLFEQLRSLRAPTAKISPQAVLNESQGPIYVGEGARIGHQAVISGPAYIGPNSLVGDFCFVRRSSVEKGAVVGANAELARSILMPGSSFHFGYMADSILGKNSWVGAGLITANKRLDEKPIRTLLNDQMTETQKNKLGMIVGSEAKLGIRVNTMPGTIIGSKATVYPGLTIRHNIGVGETVKK